MPIKFNLVSTSIYQTFLQSILIAKMCNFCELRESILDSVNLMFGGRMPVHLLKSVVFTIYNQDSTVPLIVQLHIENSEFRIIITTLNLWKTNDILDKHVWSCPRDLLKLFFSISSYESNLPQHVCQPIQRVDYSILISYDKINKIVSSSGINPNIKAIVNKNSISTLVNPGQGCQTFVFHCLVLDDVDRRLKFPRWACWEFGVQASPVGRAM